MNIDDASEFTVWDFLNDVRNQKSGKIDFSKVREVSNRKHLVEKYVKNNKERINIPNATIQHYHYRYEQDSEFVQNQDESEALRTSQSNKKRPRSSIESNQETNESKDLIITDKDDVFEQISI